MTSKTHVLETKHMPSWYGFVSTAAFIALIAGATLYIGSRIYADLAPHPSSSSAAYLLLGIALLIALGFEFVNGFHDTANAVATVIYTRSLPPTVAVVWSGTCNFLGVLTSTGAVAFGIVSLLPVELILQVGSAAGFAMVFALLIAAIIWNLGTWYFGLPSSSSHTLIGSIIGVGVTNQLMAEGNTATSGVDWGKAMEIGQSLLLSPILGFFIAAILLVLLKVVIKSPALYKEPDPHHPPPLWIRSILFLTCSGVSFFHGSNDGQKGMGLIMLILIGAVPTAYALNPSFNAGSVQSFTEVTDKAVATLGKYSKEGVVVDGDPRDAVKLFIQTRVLRDETLPALAKLAGVIEQNAGFLGKTAEEPVDLSKNIRNDMYQASETLKIIDKKGLVKFEDADKAALKKYKGALDGATKFIPDWVKFAVAIALGLGTMVGWKRIVVTVGEKIGKTHMTYAQGASAELVAMSMIAAADNYGLPVSTTHVLSSGVAGTMAANGSGLQWGTIRNMLMAWVLTLPVSIMISGTLFWLFRNMF
jgi:PiT family inorganic phosphate transporter